LCYLEGRQRTPTADYRLIVSVIELYFVNEHTIQSHEHFLLANSDAYAISTLESWQHSADGPISEKRAGIAVPTYSMPF